MNHNSIVDSDEPPQDQLKHLPINHEIYIKEEILEGEAKTELQQEQQQQHQVSKEIETNLNFQEINSNGNTSDNKKTISKQTELVFVYPPTMSAEERAERKKIRNRKYQVEFRRRRKLKKEQDEILQYQRKQQILKELKEPSQQVQVEFQTYDELVAEMNRERNEPQQNLNLNHEIHIKKEVINDQQQPCFETFSVTELIPQTELEPIQQSNQIHIKEEILDDQQQQQYYETFRVTDLKFKTENPESEYRQHDIEMDAKQIQHLQINHEIQVKEEILEHPKLQDFEKVPVADSKYSFEPYAVKNMNELNSKVSSNLSNSKRHKLEMEVKEVNNKRTSKGNGNQEFSQEALEAKKRERCRRNQYEYRQQQEQMMGNSDNQWTSKEELELEAKKRERGRRNQYNYRQRKKLKNQELPRAQPQQESNFF